MTYPAVRIGLCSKSSKSWMFATNLLTHGHGKFASQMTKPRWTWSASMFLSFTLTFSPTLATFFSSPSTSIDMTTLAMCSGSTTTF